MLVESPAGTDWYIPCGLAALVFALSGERSVEAGFRTTRDAVHGVSAVIEVE